MRITVQGANITFVRALLRGEAGYVGLQGWPFW